MPENGDVHVPGLGKMKQSTLIIGGLVVAGVVALFLYEHAKSSQQQNVGKASGTGMKGRGALVNGYRPGRHHYTWEYR
jgi:hypothetical protein